MTDTTDHPSRRAGLRDELRRAVCEAEGFAWDSDMLEPDEYGDHADAVLAVLYREWPWLRAEAEDAAAVVPAADRAAVLAEAIARVEDPEERAKTTIGLGLGLGWESARDVLRRMAAEAAVPAVGVAADTTPVETLTAAVASCPGRELNPNPCRCPCYGCKHHCAAHNPDDAPGPVVPAQPGNDTKTLPVGYSGKGRLWCLTCPRADGEDVPVTVDVVCVGELCAGCGRDVVDVARATEERPTSP